MDRVSELLAKELTRRRLENKCRPAAGETAASMGLQRRCTLVSSCMTNTLRDQPRWCRRAPTGRASIHLPERTILEPRAGSARGKLGVMCPGELRVRTSYFFSLVMLACSGLRGGATRPLPVRLALSEVTVAEARTDEADGLRVLWNAATRGRDLDCKAWTANSPEELDALWDEAGPPEPVPSVDFSRYVVFGLARGGSYCQREISSAVAERSGTLRLRAEDETIICPDVLVRVALVVAVPRRLLNNPVLLVAPELDRAFEFDVRDATRTTSPQRRTSPAISVSSNAERRLEMVPRPARGHLALRTLRSGEQVWVAHESDGSLSVVSAVTSIGRWPLEGLPDYLQVPVEWRADIGRFNGGWDWQGHNVHGFAPLRPHQFIVDEHGSLWVGDLLAPVPGPVRPRRLAPELDGSPHAYETSKISSWSALRDGEVALVELDLVSSPSAGVRLCSAPKTRQSSNFHGCPREAPVVAGSPEHPAAPPFALSGPFVVRRSGTSAEVILRQVPQRLSWAPPLAQSARSTP